VTLLNQCRRLLLARGATLDGSAPQAVRGHLRCGTDVLVIVPGAGMPLSEEEKRAIDAVRMAGGIAFAVRAIEELEKELEGLEA
jgi:hypothetical protein